MEHYEPTSDLYFERDDEGRVRAFRPSDRNRRTRAEIPQQAAIEFLTEHAAVIGIDPAWFTGAAGVADEVGAPSTADGIELRYADEKTQFDTTTVAFQQTWRGLPVWRSGVAVVLRSEPRRVASGQNSTYRTITVDLPSTTKLRRSVVGQRGLLASALPVAATARMSVAVSAREDARVLVVSDRLVVARYDAAKRFSDGPADDADEQIPFPKMVLSPAPDIEDGSFRIAREVVFSLLTPPRGRVTWLVLVDVETAAVLYLRPFVANATGLVFARDPLTAGGTAGPDSTQATLNSFRTSESLPDLTAPGPGVEQSLTGPRVTVSDFELATAAPPTEPSGTNFDYGSRTNDFAGVNAYYHNDRFFRLAIDLGFNLATYFNGTTFPVPVDHRGRFGSADGIEINASCSGNGMGGIANVDYELAHLGDTTNPIGLATDWRVVLHELGGHGILYDHVNSANFGFAHSAGDSFAAILSDPDTLAADRFLTFPWVANVINRRHDRPVGGGWGWGGSNDVGGYSSEQVLSTSHFRMYRSIGGDSSSLGLRRFAARVSAYLMLRAVGTLTPLTNPSNATAWVTALLAADAGDWTTEGLAGGAYGKVIRWAFEKQGLYQAAGSPTPVTQEGAPPAVDVYIDDGRHGEYQHQPVHWNCQNVWNRRFADNGTSHEDPWLGRTNFAYTRVRNRGTQTATGVVVRGFHCNPGAGLTWPDDWQAMATAQLAVPDIPSGGEVMVGPFSWVPSQPDHECLLMIASATGDSSNIDVFGPGESIAEWRLVPHDNNIGQRNVHPVPAAGGAAGIASVLDGRAFTVRNPFDRRVKVRIDISLPPVLAGRRWKLGISTPGGSAFSLPAGGARTVRLAVSPGGEVSKGDVESSAERDVVVSVHADEILIGGMSYQLDPSRSEPMPQDDERDHGCTCTPRCTGRCKAAARDLLRCLDLPGGKVSGVKLRHVGVDIQIDDC